MTTTTPTPATLDDLEALDVNTLDGTPLAIFVALARGYRWYVVGAKNRPCLALMNHDSENVAHYELWDGQDSLPVAVDKHHWLERPDRDEKAAVQLLNEGVERWGGVQIAADMEEWEAGGLYWVGFYDAVVGWCAPFTVAVCRAFLHAWQAERRAEREREGVK